MGGGGLHTTPTPESEFQESQSPSVLEQSMALYVFLLHSSAAYAQTYCTTDFHFVVICLWQVAKVYYFANSNLCIYVSDRDRITMPPSHYVGSLLLIKFQPLHPNGLQVLQDCCALFCWAVV